MVFNTRPTLNLCNVLEEDGPAGARTASGASAAESGAGFLWRCFLLWFVLKISPAFLISVHTKSKARQ